MFKAQKGDNYLFTPVLICGMATRNLNNDLKNKQTVLNHCFSYTCTANIYISTCSLFFFGTTKKAPNFISRVNCRHTCALCLVCIEIAGKSFAYSRCVTFFPVCKDLKNETL